MGREPAPMLADYQNHLAHDDVLVAEDAASAGVPGAVTGFAVIVRRAHEYWLENIAVDPAHQGRGLGAALLAAVEARLAPKATYYRLYTNAVMEKNILWYPRLGFTETHRGEEDGYNRVYFKKDLSAGPAP